MSSPSSESIDPEVADTIVITVVRDGHGRTVVNIGEADPHHALGMLLGAVDSVQRNLPDTVFADSDGEHLDVEVTLEDDEDG